MTLPLFLWVWLLDRCSAKQIVYANTIIICQFVGVFQRQRTLSTFIFRIQGLIAKKIICDLFLIKIPVFP